MTALVPNVIVGEYIDIPEDAARINVFVVPLADGELNGGTPEIEWDETVTIELLAELQFPMPYEVRTGGDWNSERTVTIFRQRWNRRLVQPQCRL